MYFITRIRIQCHQQEDATGKDDLRLHVGGVFCGNISQIGTGEARDLAGEDLLGRPIEIAPGDHILFQEIDLLDPNDVLLDHPVTRNELEARHLSLSDTHPNARYTFKFDFQEI